ncbi:Wobble nucleotide-excising tRNase [Pseudomonas sp. NFPP33]|nr:AAA family ATPase [Pseudomonas sp. NFPP33]SDA53293.1 Wobble nucleotide-excising tRNase [Pseudomonas sp. NFPP33]
MIGEIVIRDVASYKAPVTLTPANKTSLFYGLNGAGKSTISSLLYSPQNPRFKNCQITKTKDCEILVYNQDFLNDYFYEEDSLKGIFTLSKENKEILKKIEEETESLQKAQKALDLSNEKIVKIQDDIQQERSKASTKTWEIKTKYSGGDRVLEFCLDKLKRTELLFDHISSIPLPISEPNYSIEQLKHETSLIQGEGAVTLSPVNLINATWLNIEQSPLFGKIIVGSQEGSVAQFIAKLGNTDWIQSGLKYIQEPSHENHTNCPFCQEQTITPNLISSIKDIFNEDYDNDLAALKALEESYSSLTRSLQIPSISHLPISTPTINTEWDHASASLSSVFRENLLLIDRKIKSPSSPITLKSSQTEVNRLNTIAKQLNEEISQHNTKLSNKKKAIDEIKEKFWTLMRWDYDQTISLYNSATTKLNDEHTKHKSELEANSKNLAATRLKIAELRKQTVNIEEAIQNINNALLEIGINEFSVVKHTDSLYRISRSESAPNTFISLSEGEKTVISFLYFIELCKGQKNATDVPLGKVVVIDDPISSLSHIYVFNIGQLIKRHFINNPAYEQLLIVTHSLYFFYELTFTKKEDRDNLQNLYRVFKNSSGSNITKMKYEEIQNDYQSYWSTIKDNSTPPALIANCMRNIIEYFFNFVQKKDFNNVFQKPSLKSDKFAAFYRYMNRESHSLGQNIFDIKEFDYETFKEGLRLVFEECGYGDHYKAMTK